MLCKMQGKKKKENERYKKQMFTYVVDDAG